MGVLVMEEEYAYYLKIKQDELVSEVFDNAGMEQEGE